MTGLLQPSRYNMSDKSVSKMELAIQITEWLQTEITSNYTIQINELLKQKEITVSDLFYYDSSLRLHSYGCRVLKIYFDHEIFICDKSLTAGDLMNIGKNLNSPYFITTRGVDQKSTITLFGHEQIVLCKMSGSVTHWLNNLS